VHLRRCDDTGRLLATRALLAPVQSTRNEPANALMIAAAIPDAKTLAAHLDDRSERVRRMASDAVKRLGDTAA